MRAGVAERCDVRAEPIDRRGRGRPRGHEADHVASIGTDFPTLEVVALRQLRGLLRADGDELLIGRRVAGELRASGQQSGAQTLRHRIGMRSQLEEQSILEQGGELRAQHHALGQQRAALLDQITEVGLQCGIDDDQGFAEQGTVLGAADVERIGQRGDRR